MAAGMQFKRASRGPCVEQIEPLHMSQDQWQPARLEAACRCNSAVLVSVTGQTPVRNVGWHSSRTEPHLQPATSCVHSTKAPFICALHCIRCNLKALQSSAPMHRAALSVKPVQEYQQAMLRASDNAAALRSAPSPQPQVTSLLRLNAVTRLAQASKLAYSSSSLYMIASMACHTHAAEHTPYEYAGKHLHAVTCSSPVATFICAQCSAVLVKVAALCSTS